MSQSEIATGWLTGFEPGRVVWPDTPQRDPRRALETVLIAALSRPPCLVEFSGGRDSSALLAAAIDLSRRTGLDEPVAVSWRFPGIDSTDETVWQEQVVRHIGVREWERPDLIASFDLLGAVATCSLLDYGLLWPPTLHTRSPIWAMARGGSVVNGEGGDEILGVRRVTPLTGLKRRKVSSRRRAIAAGARALLPRPVRSRAIARRDRDSFGELPWLRADVLREFRRNLVGEKVAEPLRWDRSIRMHISRRSNLEGTRDFRLMAQQHNVQYVAPFLHPDFVAALARLGGAWGFAGRSEGMLTLFGDLLPAVVLTRRTKAEFLDVYFGPETRRFITSWDGGGVDHALVDPDGLRSVWRSTRPHSATAGLLHACWLAKHHRD